VEIHPDEQAATACGFWTRARAWFAERGITVQRVLTDNGACYRSHLWRQLLQRQGVTHKRTRPYRPATNGKVERFNRTLLAEWAYARPYWSERARRAALPAWLHRYNHHRPHTALAPDHPPAASLTSPDRTASEHPPAPRNRRPRKLRVRSTLIVAQSANFASAG
jgi:transposase InsO family protein